MQTSADLPNCDEVVAGPDIGQLLRQVRRVKGVDDRVPGCGISDRRVAVQRQVVSEDAPAAAHARGAVVSVFWVTA